MPLRPLAFRVAFAACWIVVAIACVTSQLRAPSVEPFASKPLAPSEKSALVAALTDFFTAPSAKQESWKFPGRFEKPLRENEAAVRIAAWESFRDAPIHEVLKQD